MKKCFVTFIAYYKITSLDEAENPISTGNHIPTTARSQGVLWPDGSKGTIVPRKKGLVHAHINNQSVIFCWNGTQLVVCTLTAVTYTNLF